MQHVNMNIACLALRSCEVPKARWLWRIKTLAIQYDALDYWLAMPLDDKHNEHGLDHLYNTGVRDQRS